MRISLCAIALLLAGPPTAFAGNTETDPAQKYAWAENVGWVNAGPTNDETRVHFDGGSGWLSGHAWGENIGWIKMGSDLGGPYANATSNNWGVNMAADGQLSGYAWGQNVGWINFGHGECDAAIDPSTGRFTGHAWGENIGWLKFSGSSPDYAVRTLAFDTQAQGTPNWWLDHHGVSEAYDAGDGIPAWQKFVMDTDPNVEGDYLRITSVSNMPTAWLVAFTPASTSRYYTLARTVSLAADHWSNVLGQVAVRYAAGGQQTMEDTNALENAFYMLEVSVSP